MPAKEFSSFLALNSFSAKSLSALGTETAAAYSAFTCSILREGPNELSAQRTRLMIMITLPASVTNTLALVHMVLATFLQRGDLYTGSSSIKKLFSLILINHLAT